MQGGVCRRDFIRTTGLGAVAAMAAGALPAVAQTAGRELTTTGPDGRYALPELPYAYKALEPFLGRQTLQLHHGKHHQAYVNGLNSTLDKLSAARQAGDLGAVKHLSRELAFHGSGHVLHTLYWHSMTPGGTPISGKLAELATREFGSAEALLSHFAEATTQVEASGWGVVAYEPTAGRLLVLQAEKHQDLTIWGAVPILVCDVWEHAYYLDYQNRRSDYVKGFLGVADWASAGGRLAALPGVPGA